MNKQTIETHQANCQELVEKNLTDIIFKYLSHNPDSDTSLNQNDIPLDQIAISDAAAFQTVNGIDGYIVTSPDSHLYCVASRNDTAFRIPFNDVTEGLSNSDAIRMTPIFNLPAGQIVGLLQKHGLVLPPKQNEGFVKRSMDCCDEVIDQAAENVARVDQTVSKGVNLIGKVTQTIEAVRSIPGAEKVCKKVLTSAGTKIFTPALKGLTGTLSSMGPIGWVAGSIVLAGGLAYYGIKKASE